MAPVESTAVSTRCGAAVHVVGRRERFAEAHRRLAQPPTLLVQLRHPGLELVGHLVEGVAETCELVAALDDGHAPVEAALCDVVGGRYEPAERADDRATLEVGDQDQEHERDQHRQLEPARDRSGRSVDRPLRLEQHETRTTRRGRRLGRKGPEAIVLQRHLARLARGDAQAGAAGPVTCEDPSGDDEGQPLVGVEAGPDSETADEPGIDRYRRHDLAESPTISADDRHRSGSRARRRPADAQPRSGTLSVRMPTNDAPSSPRSLAANAR